MHFHDKVIAEIFDNPLEVPIENKKFIENEELLALQFNCQAMQKIEQQACFEEQLIAIKCRW